MREELKRKIAQHRLNQEAEEGWRIIQRAMNKGVKLEFDFESLDWLTGEQKETCRQWDQSPIIKERLSSLLLPKI